MHIEKVAFCIFITVSELAAGCDEEQANALRSPRDAGVKNALGWCVYRTGDFEGASRAFAAALKLQPGSVDAELGLAYAEMQQGRILPARAGFREVLRRRPDDGDARRGLSLAALRAPVEELRLRKDADRARPMAVPARARDDYLEVLGPDGVYAPMFVKGVNLGSALPGKFPTEHPRDVAVYLGWLDTIADLGGNVVRVYTLMPPEFYRALATHNALRDARKLWLIQGVWAELPERGDFAEPGYVAEFHSEIERVVDAIHGDLVSPARPGHAHGIYDADASSSLLAFVIGREWEPFAVQAFNARHQTTSYAGRYFRAEAVPPMEAWVAGLCDHTAGYEARRYRMLHPVTFANWPTLDPLRHETESNRDEEDAWRGRYRIPYPEAYRDPPWENDRVALDATKIVPTTEMRAGFFAAYHIYPNYPDFLNLEPGYAGGDSRYARYLEDLKRYHGRQPVLVAEFGISTSRGVAHVQPEGWDHGGHDERRQGELLARMLGAIHEERYAGGIVFELMDEWFKGTWSVAPLSIPAERRRLWFNAESPEQSYGLIAHRPAAPVRVDGDPSDWAGGAYTVTADRVRSAWGTLRETRLAADEGYLYVLIRTGGGPGGPDWERAAYRIAIDTYDAARGATRLPEPGPATIPTGAEFLVDIAGPGRSDVKVVASYEPYAVVAGLPASSPVASSSPDSAFVPLTMETNRERFGRDGTRYPAIRVDRGALRFGSIDFDTRTDVALGESTGTIELRIPWALLNVTDPSSRRVLHQETPQDPPAGTVITPGFRVYVLAVDPSRADRKPLSRLPAAGETAPLFTWPAWEAPRYRTEPKAGVDRLRAAFGAIPDRGGHAR
jgi:hypothetical protein